MFCVLEANDILCSPIHVCLLNSILNLVRLSLCALSLFDTLLWTKQASMVSFCFCLKSQGAYQYLLYTSYDDEDDL